MRCVFWEVRSEQREITNSMERRVLLEKLTVKKFPAFYGTERQ
jgi:hypothetical protein